MKKMSVTRKLFKVGFLATGLFFCLPSYSVNDVPPPIAVEPAFRATPIWYWKENNQTCVPVPSYDVILRIGPKEMRDANVSSNGEACSLTLHERRLIAVLSCQGKTIEKFYAKERLCRAAVDPVAQRQTK